MSPSSTSACRSLLNCITVNGVLQPFTGPLSLLVPPTPQPRGLKTIPGTEAYHKYIAPGPTDRRGVCPALNTLADHGFLSRDGITTWAEAGNAIQTAFGFRYDLATILSALGLLSGGDLITGKFSISTYLLLQPFYALISYRWSR